MSYILEPYALTGLYAPPARILRGPQALDAIADMFTDLDGVEGFLAGAPVDTRSTSVSYRSDDGSLDEYGILVIASQCGGPDLVRDFAEQKMNLRAIRKQMHVADDVNGRTQAGGVAAYLHAETAEDLTTLKRHIATGDMDHDAFFLEYMKALFPARGYTAAMLDLMAFIVMCGATQRSVHIAQGVLRRFRKAGCDFATWEAACLRHASGWRARNANDLEMLLIHAAQIVVFFDPDNQNLVKTYVKKAPEYANRLGLSIDEEAHEWIADEAEANVEMCRGEANDFDPPDRHWYTPL